MADTELRRRHPDLELPPLHPAEEADQSGSEAEPDQAEETERQVEADSNAGQRPTAKVDIEAALTAARKAQQILAGRAGHEAELDSDVVRRREAEARQEADARRGAVRQEPAPSRREVSLELDELELEAGQ